MVKPYSQSAILGRLKFRHLRVAVALRDLPSARQVAEHLNVSQAAISKTIAELEALFGLSLFERVGGEKRPNAQGLALIGQMETVLLRAESMAGMVVDIRDGNIGDLKIGVATDVAKFLLAHLVPEFQQQYARIRVEIIAGGQQPMIDALGSGRIDLLFSYRDGALAGPEYSSARVMAPQSIAVVANRDLSPLARRKDVTVPDLHAAPWIMPRPGTMMHMFFESMFQSHGLGLPARGFHSSDFVLIDNFLRRTAYLALVPTIAARRLESDAGAAILGLDLHAKVEPVLLTWMTSNAVRPAVRIFSDFCRANASRYEF